MRILVTGAAGLTAGAVVQALADSGDDVVGLVHRQAQVAEVQPGSTIVVGDSDNVASIRTALDGCDALVHVSGILRSDGIAEAPEVSNLRRVVVISTAGIYSVHRNSAAAYAASEARIRAVKPDAVFLRPTMIYGSQRDRNVHHVIDFAERFNFLPLVGPADAPIQPIHYLDVAAIAVALLRTTAAGPVDAGGGRALTVRDAAAAVFAALGRPARLVPVPHGPVIAAARGIDALRGSRWRERLERLTEDRSVDNSQATKLTGIEPRRFEDGVRQQITERRRAQA